METDEYRPVVRSDVSWTDVDEGGGVVFDSEADKIHTLNSTAAYVWTLSDGSRSARDIALEISDLSKEPFQKVLADVENVLKTFALENLLLSDHEGSS